MYAHFLRVKLMCVLKCGMCIFFIFVTELGWFFSRRSLDAVMNTSATKMRNFLFQLSMKLFRSMFSLSSRSANECFNNSYFKMATFINYANRRIFEVSAHYR